MANSPEWWRFFAEWWKIREATFLAKTAICKASPNWLC